jgi:hypothetical protein
MQFIAGIGGELLDVTSLSRPDITWRYVDAMGHWHQWYADGNPAESYSPLRTYDVPTLTCIVDVEGDDEHPAISHYECRECRRIERR